MAISNNKLHLFALLVVLSFSVLARPSAATPTSYPTDTAFIIKSCNGTTHPTFCLSTLLPSDTRIGAHPKKFAYMAILNTLFAAKNASATTVHLSKQNRIRSHEASALKNCANLVNDSIKNLNQTLGLMGHLGGGNKAEKEYKRRNMENLVGVVDMVEDSCIQGLKEMNARPVVVDRINDVILPLARHAANVHDIFNRLVF